MRTVGKAFTWPVYGLWRVFRALTEPPRVVGWPIDRWVDDDDPVTLLIEWLVGMVGWVFVLGLVVGCSI